MTIAQSDILRGVADALNKIQSRVDFLSMHEDEFNGVKHAPFHSFIRIAMKIDRNYTGGTKLNLDARIVAQRMMSTTSKSPIGKPEIVGLYWYTFTGRRCLINQDLLASSSRFLP